MSSSYADVWCREDRKRYRHQWSQSSRVRRRQRNYLQENRRGGRAWSSRTFRSKDHGTLRFQELKDRNHGRDQERRQKRESSCKHRPSRWTDAPHQSWHSLHHWQDEYEHNPGSKQTKGMLLRQPIKYQQMKSCNSMSQTYSTRSQVSHHPLSVPISLLLKSEHRFVGITESKVKCLRREVSNDVGSVTSP